MSSTVHRTSTIDPSKDHQSAEPEPSTTESQFASEPDLDEDPSGVAFGLSNEAEACYFGFMI